MKPRPTPSTSPESPSPGVSPHPAAAGVSAVRWTSTRSAGDSPAAARDTLRRRHREVLEGHPLGALSREAWDQPEARRLRDRIEGRTVVLHAPTAAPAEVPNAVC